MKIGSAIDSETDELSALGERMGRQALQRRLTIQAERTEKARRSRRMPAVFNRSVWKQTAIKAGLHATGMYGRGQDNYRDIQIRQNVVSLPALPPQFDGMRILHLSDLHIDLDPTLTDVIIDRADKVDYDICVITGDFRSDTVGPFDLVVSETARLADQLHGPIYAILGNHDFVEFVPPLERHGVQFLLNETVTIRRSNAILYLSGIDDPHFYATDDLFRTSRTIPTDQTSILLSHTPDSHLDASTYGYDLMLCGHTHAGQICLPGGRAIQRNVRSPQEMLQGDWFFRQMAGYTSAGVGATGVPIRFFCPPEIVIHELRTAASTSLFEP